MVRNAIYSTFTQLRPCFECACEILQYMFFKYLPKFVILENDLN